MISKPREPARLAGKAKTLSRRRASTQKSREAKPPNGESPKALVLYVLRLI